jgi:hypothetical protein
VGTAQVVQRIVNILGLSMVFLDPLPDQDEIAADSPSAVVPARPAQAPDAADSAPGEG